MSMKIKVKEIEVVEEVRFLPVDDMDAGEIIIKMVILIILSILMFLYGPSV